MTKYLLIVGGIIILSLGGLLKFAHSKYIEQKVQTELVTAQLNGVNKKFKSYVSDTENTIAEDREANSKLQDKFNKIQVSANELSEKLSKHDLNELALRKPTLITRIINRATKRVLRELKQDSRQFARPKTSGKSFDTTGKTKSIISK